MHAVRMRPAARMGAPAAHATEPMSDSGFAQLPEPPFAWREQPEHAATRAHGRAHWYDHYEVRIAKVERAYRSKPAA